MPGPSKKPTIAHLAALVGAGATAATAASVARAKRRPGTVGAPNQAMPFATDSAFVALIESVAAATSDAETIDVAMRACVEHVCRWTGWPVGHVYLAGR